MMFSLLNVASGNSEILLPVESKELKFENNELRIVRNGGHISSVSILV